MRFLFVTYCFGDDSGQTLVGVYKRGLRIALELHDRGHEVLFDCTGRSTYRDDLTVLAEQRIEFVDLRLALNDDGGDYLSSRERALRAISDCGPDLVVIGEAPLAGTLLEGTLSAVELGIPVALLDNAYNERAVGQFLLDHAGMVDGVVLTGPSCTHTQTPPPYLEQVPPLVTIDPAEARRVLGGLGFSGERLVCVLAYDAKTERLGLSLLERLEEPDTEFVFISRRVDACRRRVAELSTDVQSRVGVLPLVPDPVLFGLIELSKLAVVKYGFMQVSECMALHTPVICTYHEGPTWVNLLPRVCSSFIHVAEEDEADAHTVAAARDLLGVPSEAMRSIHVGDFDAIARAADFLERLAAKQRRDASAEAVIKFPEEQVRAAVRAAMGRQPIDALQLRTMRLRKLPGEELHSLVCRCGMNGTERVLRLWGRRFGSPWGVTRRRFDAALAGRRVLFASARQRTLIEFDVGQAVLPPLL